MIRTLTIEGYRCFRRFELQNLGRINLIVGTNNSGKTSILEAVNLLASQGDYSNLWSTLWRRGEEFDDRERRRTNYQQVDVRRLFHGHELTIGCQFAITAFSENTRSTLKAEILEARDFQPAQPELFDYDEPGTGSSPDIIRPATLGLSWNGEPPRIVIPVSRRGGIAIETLRTSSRISEINRSNNRFISASSLSPEGVVQLFEEVVLTPDEDLVVEALRIIEPSILRLASSGTERLRSGRGAARGGLLVKCEGVSDRIPIGSMGDGIWRLLGLTLALVRTEGGVLLIDEIDTGLHYSVMESMWKLIGRIAARLNIQVFATTHNRDCYESLAVIANENVTAKSEVAIHRVERGRSKSVTYTEQEIVAAATRGMEVR